MPVRRKRISAGGEQRLERPVDHIPCESICAHQGVATGQGGLRGRESWDSAAHRLLSQLLPTSILRRRLRRAVSDCRESGLNNDLLWDAYETRVAGGCEGIFWSPVDTSQEATETDSSGDLRTSRPFSEAHIPVRPERQNRYFYGNIIGVGTFSVVKHVFERDTWKSLACKIIPLTDESSASARERDGEGRGDAVSTRKDVEMEISFLRRLNHPNIMRLHDVFETDGQVHLMTEFLPGGELLKAVNERGSLPEEDAKDIIRKLLEAIRHMHSKNIVHRDIKLENLMIMDPDDITSIKLVDFGLAADLDKDPLIAVCGTPQYVAPEVLRGVTGQQYGPECDIWATGVLLFYILAGYPPFNAHNNSLRRMLRQVSIGDVDYKDPVWHLISPEAVDLLKQLLQVDPQIRIRVDQALCHPWITGQC